MEMNFSQCNYMVTFTNLMHHKKNTHKEVKIKCNLCTEEFRNKSISICHVNMCQKEFSSHSWIYATKVLIKKIA